MKIRLFILSIAVLLLVGYESHHVESLIKGLLLSVSGVISLCGMAFAGYTNKGVNPSV